MKAEIEVIIVNDYKIHVDFTLISDVALNKYSRQSSIDASGKASRAVDGNSNSKYKQNSCSHTEAEDKAWWEVDFAKIYNITGVEITNRGDCCAGRLKDFNISVDGEL